MWGQVLNEVTRGALSLTVALLWLADDRYPARRSVGGFGDPQIVMPVRRKTDVDVRASWKHVQYRLELLVLDREDTDISLDLEARSLLALEPKRFLRGCRANVVDNLDNFIAVRLRQRGQHRFETFSSTLRKW